jgi:hypothetical protein
VTVAELQKCLRSFGEILGSTGAKSTVVGELELVRAKLEIFREQNLKDFADFLERAEAYWRGGEIPMKKASPGRSSSGKGQGSQEAARNAALRIRDFYARATDPAVTRELVEATVQALNPLKKDDLLDLAAQMEISQKLKTKADILKALERKILDRKGAFLRVQA